MTYIKKSLKSRFVTISKQEKRDYFALYNSYQHLVLFSILDDFGISVCDLLIRVQDLHKFKERHFNDNIEYSLLSKLSFHLFKHCRGITRINTFA